MTDLFKGFVCLSQAEYKQMLDEGRVGNVIYDRNYLYITPELADLAGTTVHIGDNIVDDLLFTTDPQEQLNDKVSLSESQTITGPKTFTENIYLANADGTVDRISHINNNFVIYSGSENGVALLNIDEGLNKIYAFNQELAFKSDIAEYGGGTVVRVDGVAVSYLSFDSDPQTQINLLSNDFENKVSKSGDTISGELTLQSGVILGNNKIDASNSGNTFEISRDENGDIKNIFNYTHGATLTLNNIETPLVLQGMTDRPSYVSGAGVNSDLALKRDIDTAIDGLGTVFDLKGSKDTIGDLPTTGNSIGDVWYVVSEEVGYIWLYDGMSERWERFGAPIDLSGYAEKTELNKFLPLAGGTMTGNIINGTRIHKSSNIDQHIKPTSVKYNVVDWFHDSNNKVVGVHHLSQLSNGNIEQQLDVRREVDDTGTTAYAPLIIGMTPDGTKYAKAPVPTISSDSNEIATTNWTRDVFLPLKGGVMSGPLSLSGGDGSTSGKIVFNPNNRSQITNEGTGTLFGFNEPTILHIGHPSYSTEFRGQQVRPTYNNTDLALLSDVPSIDNLASADANNLSDDNVASWKTKLGIYDWVYLPTTQTNDNLISGGLTQGIHTLDLSSLITGWTSDAEYEVIIHTEAYNSDTSYLATYTDLWTTYFKRSDQRFSTNGRQGGAIYTIPLRRYLYFLVDSGAIETFYCNLVAYRRVK